MNASTIEMSRWDARAKIREYAEAVQRNPRDEFCRTALRTFRALSLGKRVVDVAVSGFPKLALARADWTDVWYQGRQFTDENEIKRTVLFSRDRYPRVRKWIVDGASGSRLELPADSVGNLTSRKRARARVPVIPPGLRPPAKDLGRYSILFEAVWDFTEPADPFLLRHLGGTLYVILAAWDLTPVEAAIFSGARPS